MKTPGLDKVLKHHFQHCKMHEYSLMQDRHCTCGVERARREADALILAAKWIVRANGWLNEQGFDEISANSIAAAELREIVEELNGKTS